MEQQTCVRCGELKSLEKFPKTKSKNTGKEYRRHQCQKCSETIKAARTKANQAHVNTVRKQWRDAHPGHNRANHKRWRDRNRAHVNEYGRLAEIRRSYRMTPEDVVAMSNSQGGLCAACGGPPDDERSLMIDHDHVTGAVRGLLCNSCNLTLGRSKESLTRLSGLVSYLVRFQGEQNDATTGLIRIA